MTLILQFDENVRFYLMQVQEARALDLYENVSFGGFEV
jgi:hypothetical protein